MKHYMALLEMPNNSTPNVLQISSLWGTDNAECKIKCRMQIENSSGVVKHWYDDGAEYR